MNLKDLLPTTRFITHPQDLFKSKNGKPFAQSFARNLGEALTNKASADYTNQKFLGDPAPQAPQATLTGLLSSGQGTAQTPQESMQPGVIQQPTTQAMPLGVKKQSQGADLMSVMQALMQQQRGGM